MSDSVKKKNLMYISKWIRKSISEYDNFEQSIEGLKLFFRDIKVKNNASSLQHIDVEPIDVQEPRNWFTEMKNNKVTKGNLKGQRSNGVSEQEMSTKIKKFAVTTTENDCSLPQKESTAQKARSSGNNTGLCSIDLETQSRCSSPPSMSLSPNNLTLSVVKETPNDYEQLIVKETPMKATCPDTTLESVSDDEFSNSTIVQAKFPDQQQLPQSFSSPCSTSASKCMNTFVTPNKQKHVFQNNKSPLLDLSVNSHFLKRRKSLASVAVPVKIKQFDSSSPDPKTPTEIIKFVVPQSSILDVHVPETSSTTTFGDVMKKNLKISCSFCRYPLGLVENNYIVPCSLMSLSKVHLASLMKGELEGPTNVPIPFVVSDITSVDRRLLETSLEGGAGQGIWSREDGCVFNTILCTSCGNLENCLGVHVVATDSLNVQFLNKVLFYSDRLEIQHIDTTNHKEVSPSSVTSGTKTIPFEKFAYVPQETNSLGWRTTKSKMRLPKRAQISTTKH